MSCGVRRVVYIGTVMSGCSVCGMRYTVGCCVCTMCNLPYDMRCVVCDACLLCAMRAVCVGWGILCMMRGILCVS